MKVKHSYWIVTLLLICSLVLAVGCAEEVMPPDTGDDVDFRPVTLRWAEMAPPTGMRGQVVQWMADEITERTEGRVKIDMHWDTTLLTREEMLRGVMTGIADMGCTNIAFHPSALYAWGVFNTFLVGPTDLEQQLELKARVVEEIPVFNAELEAWNQRWITQFAFQSGMIGSTTPIMSLDDLSGKSVRAPSAWLLAMLQAGGAIPISMPWAETLTALDRGTLDGIYTSVDSFEVYFVDEIADYFIWHPQLWMPQPFLVTMNNDTWNSLLEKDREIISQIGIEAQQKYNDMNVKDMERGLQSMIDRSGATITLMSDEDLNTWMNQPGILELPDKWAEEAEARGIPGRQIVERVREIMEEMMF